jgi:2-polyprenyl-3-methyl-5-hydroxy-6-metoxy-1,4-benzoquinol methylase
LTTEREFPDWEQLYRDEGVETMAWFHPDLDPDLAKALRTLNLQGGRALDLGTGPGTQAMALAERGFRVTGTDISETAVKKARAKGKERGLEVAFLKDDVMESVLDEEFDFVFDRGCFHVLPPGERKKYVGILFGLIKAGGYLFLKTFSHLELREEGPYRFRPDEIEDLFCPPFDAQSFEQTVYHGTLDPFPKARVSF